MKEDRIAGDLAGCVLVSPVSGEVLHYCCIYVLDDAMHYNWHTTIVPSTSRRRSTSEQ